MLWLALIAFVALSFAVALILGPLMSLNSRCDDVAADAPAPAPRPAQSFHDEESTRD